MSPTPPFFSLRFFFVRRLAAAFRWMIGFSLAVGGVYGAMVVETGARARASFNEAEGYRRWASDPAVMRRDLEAEFLRANERLLRERARGKWTADDLRLEQDILEARFDMRRSESPAKRAYFAYRDVYRLYSPPETDLSRRARLLAPAAKQAWREEVTRRGLPVSDLLFDPEPGETGKPGETEDRRVVFSTQDRFEASNLAAILRTDGIAADVFDDRRVVGAVPQGFWLTVPPSDFWRAHGRLQSFLAPDLPAVFVKS